MQIENCQMHGQVSRDVFFFFLKGHVRDTHGPGRDRRGNKRPQDLTMYGQICGSICLISVTWTGFTRFTILKEKPPDGYTWSGRRLTRKQATSRPDKSRKQSSIMPGDCVLFTSLIPKMRNSSVSRRMHEESWKFRFQQQCLGNPPQHWKTQDKIRSYSRESEWKEIPIDHEDHIAGKSMNSLSHCNLVHKCVPMPQAMKLPDAEAAVEKREKLEKVPAWQLAKVRIKNEVIAEARMRAEICTLRH